MGCGGQAVVSLPNDWDGTNKRGEALPSATYFFVIDTKKKSQKPFQGFIAITNEQP